MKNYTSVDDVYLSQFEIKEIKTNKKVTYLNIESAFDIETTSYINNGEKSAFMYIWMFGLGLGKEIFYGRTWEEFLDLCEKLQQYFGLNENRRLVIYVHNLGYEFQFMCNYFNWENVFAINERKPIKALCSYGIEFRDSYILSGYSLANTAKNLTTHKVRKMEGDLDYSLIRHQSTQLTEKELGYCSNDIEIILAYINEQIVQYEDITKIPLTNTGRVRKYVKDACYYTSSNHRKSNRGKYQRYRQIMSDLTLDKATYIQLKRAFMGGFTHSNPNHTNKTLENVSSIDLTSSYPTVMLADKFPMSRAKELNITTVEELKKAMSLYCLVFDLKLEGLRNTLKYESYISESKCFKMVKPVINNGRVYDAEMIQTTITDVDFNIIEKVYEWDKISIANVRGFVKAYLPKSIIESILNLYQDKTTLKGVEGKEVEYLLSKGMLNSVYGMCVTDVVKDEHVFNETWGIERVDVDEKIDEYNKSKNRFLFYPWGIWVTAYARRNLWTAILNIGDDYIYSDTDSIKMLNFDKHKEYVEKYNKHIGKKLADMMEHYKLNVVLLAPKTIQGKAKPLGIWEFEGNYSHFKTLGAKRYLVKENGEFHLTVAGLSKKNGINHMVNICGGDTEQVFNIFNDNLYIPADKTGKMTHTYIDTEKEMFVVDYDGVEERVLTLSGIHLEPCDFTLSISEQYNQFLRAISSGYIFTGMKNV
ncbi:DNA polymerase [Escherichia coli]